MRPFGADGASSTRTAAHGPSAWVRAGPGSRRWPAAGVLAFVLALAAGVMLSAIVPPFQSPDEFEHVKRAYMLAHGTVVLKNVPGGNSGGFVDQGLLEYMDIFGRLPMHPQEKLDQDDVYFAANVSWTGERRFSEAAGAAYYFPGVYLPQAIGLRIGEALRLTVDQSYRLARFLACAASLAIIAFAFVLLPPNGFVAALLVLPMTLFQLASATIDGLTLALSVLTVTLFLRASDRAFALPRWLPWTVAACLFLLASSRPHLLPLLLLPLLLAVWRRSRRWLTAFGVALGLTLTWIAVAAKATVDTRIDKGASAGEIALFYVERPMQLIRVLSDTWSDAVAVEFYVDTFIGKLGWLDTPFPEWFYGVSLWVLGALALLSVSLRTARVDGYARLALLLAAIASALLVFAALLVSWTPHPAAAVSGVQGRYFLVPMMLLGYALSGRGTPSPYSAIVSLPILAGYGFLVALWMPQVLIGRYYAESPDLGYVRCDDCSMKPTAPLGAGTPVALHLVPVTGGGALRSIEILFGTHGARHRGEAELVLIDTKGQAYVSRFPLRSVRDNRYRLFLVRPAQYVSGEIRSVSGGGISTWESHRAGERRTCIIYGYTTRERRYTPGCPLE